jgi:lysophospholipase L1-like esterase
VNYLRWTLLVLLVLAPPFGCGGEPATEGSATDEPATEGSATDEPATEESTMATANPDSTLGYVALGDSLATGYGATEGYVYRYADFLSADTGHKIDVYNLGVNGLTSERLRTEIEDNRSVKDAIGQAKIITINIGANDLLWARWSYQTGDCGGADNQDCLRQAVDEFQANWDAILADVTGLRSPAAAIIRTMDFYDPLLDVDEVMGGWPNDFEVFKKYLEQVNTHIAKSSDVYGIPHAKVYEAFNGPNGDEDPITKGYVSSDGIHPNDGGHAVIAQELRRLAYGPLF